MNFFFLILWMSLLANTWYKLLLPVMVYLEVITILAMFTIVVIVTQTTFRIVTKTHCCNPNHNRHNSNYNCRSIFETISELVNGYQRSKDTVSFRILNPAFIFQILVILLHCGNRELPYGAITVSHNCYNFLVTMIWIVRLFFLI